jgi:hypothetical protein
VPGEHVTSLCKTLMYVDTLTWIRPFQPG